jgi:hypothetical protein
MKYDFSEHAIRACSRRGLSLDTVQKALDNPDQVLIEDLGRKIYQSKLKIDNKTFILRVITDMNCQPERVITAYKTTKIAKYWSDG